MSLAKLKEQGNKESFYNYLEKNKDNFRETKIDGYFDANVVADAYTEGIAVGEVKGKETFIKEQTEKMVDKLVRKSTQVYLDTHKLIDTLKKGGYQINSFFINAFSNTPKVIVTIEEELMLNDDFIKAAYTKIFELQKDFKEDYNTSIDISLSCHDNLDKDLLSSDGFKYEESF